MKQLNGDLLALALQGNFDIIIHGCNCHNTMGSGIAKQIKDQYPQAYEADLLTKKRDPSKLGNFSSALCKTKDHNFLIINGYTQHNYLPKGKCYDYNAIMHVFRKVRKLYGHLRIGYPAIGCGLAGGNWQQVKQIINHELKGCDHTFVSYKK